jgi:hypothetical protein
MGDGMGVVAYKADDGVTVLVETSDDVGQTSSGDAPGSATRGLRARSKDPLTVDHSLNDALESVRPALDAVISLMRAVGPEEWEVTLGIKLSAEGGMALIAKAAVEGNFQVRMLWRAVEQDERPS